MKCVFITGASGFIGGYTIKEFLQKDWKVLALIHRKISRELHELSSEGKVNILNGDITNGPGVKTVLNNELKKLGCHLDVIVHCAGRASDVGWRRAFRHTNFESVKHLVQISKDFGVDRFVFISTTDVYGMRDFNGETEEELPLETTSKNPYPEFKIAAENWIREHLPSKQYTIVRPAQVWGVGDQTLTPRIVDFLRRSPWVFHFGKWHGKNRWPLAHVRNVATAIFLAATTSICAGQAINITDNEFTTLDEFYRLLGGIYLPGKDFNAITIPLWLGKLFGGIVSGVSNLLNLDHPFLDPSLYALYAVSCNLDFSNKKMQQLFEQHGYPLITRQEGISEILREVRNNL